MNNECPLIPRPGYVVLRSLPPETKSPGGIYFPDSAASANRQIAIVAACGPARANTVQEGVPFPAPLEVGAKVVVSAYDSATISVNNTEYRLCEQDSVLAILTE